MMQYVLLAYRDEEWWDAMSDRERATFEAACEVSEQNLIQGLHLIDIRSVQDSAALTVRIVNGQLSLTDGSSAGSQEQLTQLLFIHAKDLNAAIQITSKMPQAQAGPIEVRPIVGRKR